MKLKLLIICTLFFTIKSFSQAYVPFQFGNTRWKNSEADFGYTKNFCYFSTDTIGILINGKKYMPIEKSQSPTPIGGVYGYIHDDTIQRKIFVFNPIDSTENLLYDFSLNAGDTVKGIFKINHFTGFVSKDTLIIDSVISKNINLISRKLFYVRNIHGGYESPYIEGIGSIFGELFNPTKKDLFTDPVFYFNCYQYNSNTLYPDTLNGANTCNSFLTSVNNYENNLISIFPNPTQNTIFIKLNTNIQITNYKLYNSIGSLIKNEQLKNNTINLQDQPTGIYYLQLQTEQGNQTTKIIKE